MCGIAGIVDATRRCPDRRILERMGASLTHRGPDEQGIAVLGAAGFSHTRLSIIDPAHGQQPMMSNDGQVMLVFNGEIYNHVELRAELELQGVNFRSHSDSEVLLQSYLHWGEECVSHFNGEWAFAVWDHRRGRLFASRDRLGIRPFHYARVGDGLVFASTIASIRQHPEVHGGPDLVGLDDIFTFWTPLPGRTFYDGVSQLPPGQSMVFENGRLRKDPYWAPSFPEPDLARTEDDYLQELEALMVDSIRLRLRSDVPIAAYLSGGLDSALTTALVRKYTDASVTTFSVTFEDADYDEQRFQDEASSHLGTDHHRVLCTGSDISEVFPDVIRHAGLPVLRTAPAPMYLLSRLAQNSGFKVVITGEGADEVFGGYDIFKEAKVRRFWLRDIESDIRPMLLRRLYPYMPTLQAQSPDYLRAFFHVDSESASSPIFSHLPRWDLTSRLKIFYSDDVKLALSDRDSYGDAVATLPPAFTDWSEFAQAQYLEMTTLLPEYILSSQGDRMLMAHSVEGRFPFLDHRVAEFGMRLPSRLKMRGLDEKYLLKRLAKELVPPSILARPKQPYRAPDVSSFFDIYGRARHPYIRDVLSEDAIRQVGLFDPRRVGALVRKCSTGRATGVKDNQAFVGILSTQLLSLNW